MASVEVARFDDLVSGRAAEAFLIDRGLTAHLADSSLVTIDPLMVRALGGLRLIVPSDEVDQARDLLARANAGEFAEPLADDDIITDKPVLPWPLIVLAIFTEPSIGYAATKRGARGWVARIGLGLVIIMALIGGAVIAAGIVSTILWMLGV